MKIEHPLRATLAQLQQVLSELSEDEYRRPLPILSNSSIGQHTRHIIEFFQTLLEAYDSGQLNYDKRERNRLIEKNQQAALVALSFIQDHVIREDKGILLSGVFSTETKEVVTVKS